jgi:hypothetical protein
MFNYLGAHDQLRTFLSCKWLHDQFLPFIIYFGWAESMLATWRAHREGMDRMLGPARRAVTDDQQPDQGPEPIFDHD